MAKTRLKRFIEIIFVQMDLKLGSYCPFQKFGDEWEIGDGAIVVWVIRIQTRFLQNRGDRSSFERCRNGGSK